VLSERIQKADDAAKTAIDILVKEAKEEENSQIKLYAAYFLNQAADALKDKTTPGDAKRKKELATYIESQM
jgi:hypothetical protein